MGRPARGIYATSCDNEVRNAVIDVFGSDAATDGLLHRNNDSIEEASVIVSDAEIRTESTNAASAGVVVQSATGAADTYGRANELNIRSIGGTPGASSAGIFQTVAGEMQYRGLTILARGEAGFMYGIQASGGPARFDDIVIDAVGDAQFTVFGVGLLGDGASLTNARIKAINTATTGSHDAVGIKANSVADVTFSDITAYPEAKTNLWGLDLAGSTGVRLIGVDARTVGAPGNVSYGIMCGGGQHEVRDSHLAADPATPGYGLYAFGDCDIDVRGTSLSGNGSLRTLNTANVLVVDSHLGGTAATSGSATDTQTCVAITYDSTGSDAFLAGPVDPCP